MVKNKDTQKPRDQTIKMLVFMRIFEGFEGF